MVYRNKSFALLSFFLSVVVGNSAHTSAPFRDDLQKGPTKFQGLSLRSGIDLAGASHSLVADEALLRRQLLKAAAVEAQEKRAVAQFAFAFAHHFLVPDWLRTALPEVFSRRLIGAGHRIPHFDLRHSLAEIQQRGGRYLEDVGLSSDPQVAALTPASRLVQQVNEIGFDEGGNPDAFAKNCLRLALNLEVGEKFDFSMADVKVMQSALYNQAAERVASLGELLSDQDAREDLYLSVGQLKLWAALAARDPQLKLTLAVDALEALSAVDKGALESASPKTLETRSHSYGVMQEALLALGAKPAGVHQYMGWRQGGM